MNDQLKQLAETLIKTGLAASMYEAIEKAKCIMNIKPQKTYTFQEYSEAPQNQETVASADIGADIKNENITLNESMRQVNVTPELVEEQKQEKMEGIKEEISERKKRYRAG